MKISGVSVFSYALPLTKPLTVGREKLSERRGFILELRDERGNVGLGEAAPLSGFSRESADTVRGQLKTLRSQLPGSDIPHDLENLSGQFEDWLGRYELAPSTRCAIETATLDLLAAEQRITLSRLISDAPRPRMSVTALLSGARSEVIDRAKALRAEEFIAFKLKVGRLPLSEEIELVHSVRREIGDEALLRLDANRGWSLDEALAFASQVTACAIDFIEEPVASIAQLGQFIEKTDMSVALDESLQEISPDDISAIPHVEAVVLKPTLLGFERAVQFSRAAAETGAVAVVSSSFESALGLTALAHIAACLNRIDVPIGLGTLEWFDSNLYLEPFPIKNGEIRLADLPRSVDAIDRSLLTETARE